MAFHRTTVYSSYIVITVGTVLRYSLDKYVDVEQADDRGKREKGKR